MDEFCETSSWETNSALSDQEKDGENRAKSQGVDSREDSDSQESITSDKLVQDRWEENECRKFQKKWHDLQAQIQIYESQVTNGNPNLPAVMQAKEALKLKKKEQSLIESLCSI